MLQQIPQELIIRINTTIVSLQHKQSFQQYFLRQNNFQELHLTICWLHPHGLELLSYESFQNITLIKWDYLKKLLDWEIRNLLCFGPFGLRGISFSYLEITGEELVWVANDTSFRLKVFCKMILSFYELKLY